MFRMQRTPLRQAKYNRNKQKCAVQRAARASTRSAVGSRSQFPMKLGSPGSVGLLPHRWIVWERVYQSFGHVATDRPRSKQAMPAWLGTYLVLLVTSARLAGTGASRLCVSHGLEAVAEK